MSGKGPWDGRTIAEQVYGAAESRATTSFTAARENKETYKPTPDRERGDTGDSARAPEPPDPLRFAEIKAQAGKRGLDLLLERTL